MDWVQGRIYGGGGMGSVDRYVMLYIISYQTPDD